MWTSRHNTKIKTKQIHKCEKNVENQRMYFLISIKDGKGGFN
jgi:hypothetical protein